MLCRGKFSFEPDGAETGNYDQRRYYGDGAWARIANGIFQLLCEEVGDENTWR